MRTLLIFVLFFLLSCGNRNLKEKVDTKIIYEISKDDTILPAGLLFHILTETINEPISNCNLVVELNKKISEDELRSVALKLRSTRSKYEKLWIGYLLPNMKNEAGYWATSNFTPDLAVEILGSTAIEQHNSIAIANNVKGKIFGKWYEQQYTSAAYVYYEKNSQFYMTTIFKDGTSMQSIMEQKKTSGGLKLIEKEDGNGEYYIITKNGDLALYNKNNIQFSAAKPTN